MTIRLECLCVDAVDPGPLSAFWAEVLGWDREVDDDGDVVLEPPAEQKGATPLLFLRVPESKGGKNRLHLDLRPDDQAAEVARIEALGATRADVGQGPDVTWVVLADPEGNEFCVLGALSQQERAAG